MLDYNVKYCWRSLSGVTMGGWGQGARAPPPPPTPPPPPQPRSVPPGAPLQNFEQMSHHLRLQDTKMFMYCPARKGGASPSAP